MFDSQERGRGPANPYKAPESPCAYKRLGVRNLFTLNAGHQSGQAVGGIGGLGPYKAP
ncbi:hypothetical protein BGW36DRAFT_369339 [Talaromyces proteolyticus]|uniref:Uncharacterized protein n=1 Tax=Talaromyces proteolyticus TaxID=1131652 RepID=A0AAD4L0U9_9EURO|nr:uncharacterized protein BGW36DRAFT_369339 [Talaromyces proteolyticus]KAH8703440.1 hypothetical protein BGW36DRAFT_369339 [Talaromyces proteolyticus]